MTVPAPPNLKISSVFAPPSIATPKSLAIPPPSADGAELVCNTVDFEGIGNNSSVGTISGTPNVTFGNSWLGLVDADNGGSGNFANEPSPNTIAYFLNTGDISIRFDLGIQLVEFFYVASASSLPITVSAYDIDGNLVDRATGNTIGTSPDGAACNGDPGGSFCLWGKIILTSTSNNIRDIEIVGTIANQFGIDDLKLCVAECSPPPGGGAVPHQRISIPDKCAPSDTGNCIERRDFAGDSQLDCLLSEINADSGEKLQLWCIKARPRFFIFPGVDWYGLYYFSPDGTHNRVGQCPFEQGMNDGMLFHSGDSDGDGDPDCFIRTRWTSKDQQVGDRDDDGDGKIDWWVFTYDVISNNLTKVNYESTDGPGGTDPDSVSNIDPQLGPETEAFFDELNDELQENAPTDCEDCAMLGNPFEPCDLNQDGTCDAVDRGIFESAFGSCEEEVAFNSDADPNGDGCVTIFDQEILFQPYIEIQIDIKPGSDPNSINLGSAGVIPVAILSTQSFDATTVDPQTITLSGASVKLAGKSAKYLAHKEDVNGDGLTDLVCQVYTAQFFIEAGSSIAVLEGTTYDGTSIHGEDIVQIVPDN